MAIYATISFDCAERETLTSCTCTMFEWCNPVISCPSVVKRVKKCGSDWRSVCRIFTATSRCCWVSYPFHTSPTFPLPSGCCSSYFPRYLRDVLISVLLVTDDDIGGIL